MKLPGGRGGPLWIKNRITFQKMPGEMTTDAGHILVRTRKGPCLNVSSFSMTHGHLFQSIGINDLSISITQSFSHTCRRMSSLPNEMKFIINHKMKLFQWKSFHCRNIWKLLEMISNKINMGKIAIYRIRCSWISAKFVLTFVFPYLYVSIFFWERNCSKLKLI